ncbi:putative F-box domain-containing protein [Rosa chinensis]|uniref:Putative F-box domain-containing protein n=1 Tax=Rosa chinensis TaxID=74649 RepID=A0A2P6PMX8_ROSCH|nr:putative F-box domain-containing protein [Rosa chinensis]
MAKSCILSEEMVTTQIVSRLPPKSLMRFKCVCKLWYKVIGSPSFLTMHLSNSMHNKFYSFISIVFKLTILKDKKLTEEEIYHVLRDSSDRKQVLLSLLNLCNNTVGDGPHLQSVVEDFTVPPPMGLAFTLQIVGHCDGIICLSTHAGSDRAALCNPSIKEFKFLPKSCLIHPPNVAYVYHVGFGYDSKAKDYKLVRIALSISYGEHPTRGEIYSLGSNSWREIKTDFRTRVYSTPGSGLYFKGNYYWYAFKQEEPEYHKEFILSFDMSDELFHHTSVPDSFHVTDGCYRSLVVLRESIALLSYEAGYGVPKTFEVWGTEGFGAGKDFWTKYVTIGPLEGIEIPLVFWKTDELLVVTNNASAVSYNLCTQTSKYLPINGAEASDIKAVVYVNSIVSVNRRQ